jgi:hypothetical protein
MDVLLTITQEKPTRDVLDSLLCPFLFYDGLDSEFIFRDVVTERFTKRYNEYVHNFACYHAKWNWLGRWLAKPKSFESWLVSEGVVIVDESHDWQFGERSVYHFAVIDDFGSVRDVYERCKPDMRGPSGALKSGERVFEADVLNGSLLDDGGESVRCSRQIGSWKAGVLIGDDLDVQMSIWQAWHRRFLVHISFEGSFEDWRNAISAGELTLEGYSEEFYDRMSDEIPSGCQSKDDFLRAAIAVGCNAVIKNGEWYEKRSDSWVDIVNWAQFVNESLLSASEESWITTLEY